MWREWTVSASRVLAELAYSMGEVVVDVVGALVDMTAVGRRSLALHSVAR
jgi:hypothetical protein